MQSSLCEIVKFYRTLNYNCKMDPVTTAKAWLRGKKVIKYFMDGALAHGTGREKSAFVKDPCTDDVLTSVAIPTLDDIITVLQSSADGQNIWSKIKSQKRGNILYDISQQLHLKKVLLGEVEALTVGSSTLHARDVDAHMASQYFEYFAGWSHLICPETRNTNGVLVYSICESSSLITLANFISSALAMGSAVIINPPLDSPLTAFLLAEICASSGLPPGVLNVIPGSLEVAKGKLKEYVNGYVMFGSKLLWPDLPNDSRSLMKVCFSKSLSVVFDSADMSSAIDVIVKNVDFTYRQYPFSVRTILVQESIWTNFIEQLKAKLCELKVGNSRDISVDIGLPKKNDYVTSEYLDNVLEYCSKRSIEVFQLEVDDSLFYPPTVLIGTDSEINSVNKDYKIIPFLSVIPFRTSKEAISLVNKNHFGSVSFWTDSVSLAVETCNNAESGMVWINCHGKLHPSVPYSLWKEGSIGCLGGFEGMAHQLLLNACNKCVSDNKHSEGYEMLSGSPVGSRTFMSTICDFPVIDKKLIVRISDTASCGQKNWWKLDNNGRASVILRIATNFEEGGGKFQRFFSRPFQEVSDMKVSLGHLYKYAATCNKRSFIKCERPERGVIVEIFQEPLGIIGILADDTTKLEPFVAGFVSALTYGNSVVIVLNLTDESPVLEFCTMLTHTKLLGGLVNIVLNSRDNYFFALIERFHAMWYIGENCAMMRSLHRQNYVMKFLWHCPNTADDNLLRLASSHSKAVWLHK